MGAEHAIRENKWRRPHARHANALASQIFHRPNVAVRSGLHAQTAAMDASGEFDIESLLDGFEEIHDQMMRHVVAAERQHVLVILPVTLNE